MLVVVLIVFSAVWKKVLITRRKNFTRKTYAVRNIYLSGDLRGEKETTFEF